MIRLLLVDDQNLICQGLQAMLDQQKDLQVVGTANNGQVAIELVAALEPDIVLMDVRMPVMDGREATSIICQNYPNIKVLVLTTFDDDEYITDSMQAGAIGYLIKDMPLEELTQAIRLAYLGYAQMGPGLIKKLVAGLPQVGKDEKSQQLDPANLSQLTPREQEVLNLLGSGQTNREIAQQLYISEGTVKTHVNHLLTRLNLKNRAQLAIFSYSITQH
jgi:DNA-binding NarL/FixJ family response regulator